MDSTDVTQGVKEPMPLPAKTTTTTTEDDKNTSL